MLSKLFLNDLCVEEVGAFSVIVKYFRTFVWGSISTLHATVWHSTHSGCAEVVLGDADLGLNHRTNSVVTVKG